MCDTSVVQMCLWFSYQLLSFGTPSGVLQCGILHLIRGQFHFLSVKRQTILKTRIGLLLVCVCVFLSIHELYCDPALVKVKYVSQMFLLEWQSMKVCAWAKLNEKDVCILNLIWSLIPIVSCTIIMLMYFMGQKLNSLVMLKAISNE